MPILGFPSPFLCYLHPSAGGVPYLEVLGDSSGAGAARSARRLLNENSDCVAIDLWRGDEMILRLSRRDANAADVQPCAA